VIGDYAHPKVRLPGSGGAAEIAINAGRVFHMIRLSRRSFVSTLDFITSPGHPSGGRSRKELGLRGNGPQLVVTDMALFDFDNLEHEMQLTSLHAGVSVDEVLAEVGWELRIADQIRETPAPTDEELRMLREDVDPTGLYSR